MKTASQNMAAPDPWTIGCIVLIVLKLDGVIDWSWWLVLGPFLFAGTIGIIANILRGSR